MSSGLLLSQTTIFRGATVRFSTTFYDFDKNIVAPASAHVEVEYPDLNSNRQKLELPMSSPAPGTTNYTAILDTRNMGTGPVNWSIHSDAPVPVAVEDGTFQLTANPANLPTF